ncbi:hypothetical protein ACFOLD_00080 [Kocuria carniphila]|uniref:hypothetical protein n=1 Tax=Kocuria carniphila TaxID=262208 RepID=UPI00361BAA1E
MTVPDHSRVLRGQPQFRRGLLDRNTLFDGAVQAVFDASSPRASLRHLVLDLAESALRRADRCVDVQRLLSRLASADSRVTHGSQILTVVDPFIQRRGRGPEDSPEPFEIG